MSSTAELAYTLEGVAQGMREDGRARLDLRHLAIECSIFAHTCGSARVTLGNTEAIVGVVAELSEPESDAPDAGRISVSVGAAGNLALPDYGGTDAVTFLEAALAPLYSHKALGPALRPLCISRGAQCWELRVHAQLISCDGCPLDALALGVRAALQSTRSLDESLPFDASGVPLFLTVSNLGPHLVADCSAAERRAAGSALSLGLNAAGEVCAVRGGGGCGVHLALAADMLQTARLLCAALLEAVADATAAALRDAQMRGHPYAESGAYGFLA
ncbi:hypothetical protein EMIHUDRAFT_201621 [Emiliania huxleyi CCMP1516]|uniref:Ribosomal RNA-processing protein 42 n=3 Tax=Emiliania huxleyi TaxID=2903 RepID=A0A0D3JYQ7_EMIH1|nr:hypothetical protein EMIHUDRAFT_234784 [Emiliania huxleyi CCMP1516]XP_005787925.1 hypothetical protein EMIHUDRAFT_201621 [Emiliania huxleyi CCMP1516]EOD28642.1 hypothetical protein EMIHUDRAFT_234784 [Emiliania huxleyi CCMP1516]EOD35496.1 hypothetical protein EMIHUDRAFT_201621 [Emiliania huxleyi CCMP1516]|eukprot:XP_005781071.1 hypothetical protein EMIHUDRAFT_234784 [Emiliania huxleyi CCMP1516]